VKLLVMQFSPFAGPAAFIEPNVTYGTIFWKKYLKILLHSVIGFFINIKSFRSHYGPGVDSSSNRNEYQEYFLGIKAAGA